MSLLSGCVWTNWRGPWGRRRSTVGSYCNLNIADDYIPLPQLPPPTLDDVACGRAHSLPLITIPCGTRPPPPSHLHNGHGGIDTTEHPSTDREGHPFPH